MIFLRTRSVFFAYGRPSTIFWAYASPMPGSAFNWSRLAVFRSTKSEDCVCAAAAVADDFVLVLAADCAKDIFAPKSSATASATVMVHEYFRFIPVRSPLRNNNYSLEAGLYPAFTASCSVIHLPCLVFPYQREPAL